MGRDQTSRPKPAVARAAGACSTMAAAAPRGPQRPPGAGCSWRTPVRRPPPPRTNSTDARTRAGGKRRGRPRRGPLPYPGRAACRRVPAARRGRAEADAGGVCGTSAANRTRQEGACTARRSLLQPHINGPPCPPMPRWRRLGALLCGWKAAAVVHPTVKRLAPWQSRCRSGPTRLVPLPAAGRRRIRRRRVRRRRIRSRGVRRRSLPFSSSPVARPWPR